MRVFCFSLLASLFSLTAWAETEAQDETPIIIGTQYMLQSDVLGDVREINVWLPAGYEEGREIGGTVYLLDGALDQDFQHIAGLAQLGALSWTFEPLIIVGVETKDRQHELTTYPTDARFQHGFPQAGGAEDFRAFLRDEVQPFIEARYRTGPRSVLAGESLAGLFVVDTFLGSPDAFDDYIAVSPSLWWDGGNLAASSRAQLDLHAPSERRLFLALADEGDMMKFGMDMLRAALADIPESFVDYAFHDFSATETHATILHPAMLKAFRSLFEMPQPDYETPWWMDEFGEPPGYEAQP